MPVILALLLTASCGQAVLFCDENTPCRDPALPFCDLTGEHPASEGHGKTCIPDPFANIDAGSDANLGQEPLVKQLVAGASHTCALFRNGAVKCWGDNSSGQLGIANTTTIGDNETPAAAPFALVGGEVASLGSGAATTCAVFNNGDLRCWGFRTATQVENIGDNETPQTSPLIDLGGPVAEVCGSDEFCARLVNGEVKCWGVAAGPRLGVPGLDTIDDPAAVNPIAIGEPVTDIDCGIASTNCAVGSSGSVYCWGSGDALGRPGFGTIGDNETPQMAGPLVLGGQAAEVAVGFGQACARLTTGDVRCWGLERNSGYGLGSPFGAVLGDDEDPGSRGNVSIGGKSKTLVAGHDQTCTVLESGAARCWGIFSGHATDVVGDNELPTAFAELPFDQAVVSIGAGIDHTCAALTDGSIFCWGRGARGRLGYGDEDDLLVSVTSKGPIDVVSPGDIP